MEKQIVDKFEYENKLLSEGCRNICGIDEVGRGPLAGPVVCCAIIMPLDSQNIIQGVDDSKKLSEKKRDLLYEQILQKAISVKVCRIEAQEIDQINILQATKKCMANCVKGLDVMPDVVLVDALEIDTNGSKCVPIIKGDLKSYTIGCASIVAKVYRDRLMDEYDQKYPIYNFKKNKGYGTAVHIKAIKENGPCELHRRSFIKNFWEI